MIQSTTLRGIPPPSASILYSSFLSFSSLSSLIPPFNSHTPSFLPLPFSPCLLPSSLSLKTSTDVARRDLPSSVGKKGETIGSQTEGCSKGIGWKVAVWACSVFPSLFPSPPLLPPFPMPGWYDLLDYKTALPCVCLFSVPAERQRYQAPGAPVRRGRKG